jgi:ribosomal-protein-alanine N-acetyltransferase
MTPVLKTARLTLSPPFIHEQMDVGYYLRWLHDESVVKYSEQRHRQHTEKSQYDYLCSFGGDNHIWEIQRDTVPIGTITAYRDPHNRVANLGIMIGETKVWGQGYGPEAWEAVCNYLFEDGIRKIEAGCMAANLAMERILRKNGFSFEGTSGGHFLLNGKPEDMNYYGKTAKAKIIPIKKERDAAYRR